MSLVRTRWAAIGAAVAVTLGSGGVALVSATTPTDAVAFVPIDPCRVVDTRPGDDNVGPRATPLAANETHTIDAVTNTDNAGDCNGVIPASATAISMNVTTLDASALTFLTIWDGSLPRPAVSSLNPAPGQPPTPNAVTTNLDVTGQFSIYNLTGSVHVLADINGYYTDHDHDDRYYTKSQSDNRFTSQSENDERYYTKSQADDRFQPATSGAEAAFTYVDFTGATGTVAEVTVDTPTFGFVVVNMHAQLQNPFPPPTSGELNCSLTDGSGIVDDHRIFSDVLESQDYQTISSTRAFQVAQVPLGRERTYRLVCETVGGNLTFSNVHLNAIFVPDSDARQPVRGG